MTPKTANDEFMLTQLDTSSRSFISLQGSIENVLFCRCGESSLKEFFLKERGFSLGLGAAGGEPDLLGEVVTWNGELLCYVPTDGSRRCLTLRGGQVRLLTPFNIALIGEPRFSFSFPQRIQLARLYEEIIAAVRREAQQGHGEHQGLVGVVWQGVVCELAGSEVRKNPSPANAPNGKINDEENKRDWFIFDALHGGYASAVGVVMDRGEARERFSQELLGRMFYANPGAKAVYPLMSHSHAFVSSHPYETPAQDASIETMRHVLEQSIFEHISGKVYLVSHIEATA
jgi:hypothetical protein